MALSAHGPLAARDFLARVERAVERARTVLDVAREPQAAGAVAHQYEDKYGLAETLVGTSVASWSTAMEALGLNARSLQRLREWAQERSVTLRFRAEERCSFARETKREVEDPSKHVREGFGVKITDKVVRTVTEYFWNFECEYEVSAFAGAEGDDAEDRVVLQGRLCKYEAMTTS